MIKTSWLKNMSLLVLCDNLEGWDGMGDGTEAQEGWDTCIPVTGSCRCVAETSIIL